MTDISPAITSSEKGAILTLDVSPGSKRASFPSGYNAWRRAVGCTVRSPASKGEANREVIGILAEFFGIPKNRISIISGKTSSVKRVLLEGLSGDAALDELSSAFRDDTSNISI